jgi:hypothetical protein
MGFNFISVLLLAQSHLEIDRYTGAEVDQNPLNSKNIPSLLAETSLRVKSKKHNQTHSSHLPAW